MRDFLELSMTLYHGPVMKLDKWLQLSLAIHMTIRKGGGNTRHLPEIALTPVSESSPSTISSEVNYSRTANEGGIAANVSIDSSHIHVLADHKKDFGYSDDAGHSPGNDSQSGSTSGSGGRIRHINTSTKDDTAL
eukprot:scaffold48762_cov29-Prasinocladus_malaysianus.AAC.1